MYVRATTLATYSMSNAIHQRAMDKAVANITGLKFKIESLEDDIRTGSTGGLTKEEFILMLKGTKIELEVWEYIAWKILPTKIRTK
jgi:hypothetical protein